MHWIAFFILFLLCACDPGAKTLVDTSDKQLRIEAVTPADNSGNIPLDTKITLRFNNDVDISTLNNSNISLLNTHSHNTITGKISYDETSKTATFSPAGHLADSTHYEIRISKHVHGTQGQMLSGSQVYSFFTQVRPPRQFEVSPQDGDSNVNVRTTVMVFFEQPMDATSINSGTILLHEANSNISVTANVEYDGLAAILRPQQPLKTATTYRATRTTAVRDFNGVGFPSDFVWTFTTSSTTSSTLLFGSSREDMTMDMLIDPENNIILAGHTSGNLGGQINQGHDDGFIMKLNNAGDIIWTRLFGGAGFDSVNDIAFDAQGNILATGSVSSNQLGGNDQLLLLRLSLNGDILLESQHINPQNLRGQGISPLSNGDFAVCANVPRRELIGGNLPDDAWVFRFDWNATLKWELNLAEGPVLMGTHDIVTDSQDRIFVSVSIEGDTAISPSFGAMDAGLLAVNPAGNALDWVQRIGGRELDHGGELHLSANGQISISGMLTKEFDPATDNRGGFIPMRPFVARYSTDGTQLWMSSWDQSRQEEAAGLAVDAMGNSYSAGTIFSLMIAPPPPGFPGPIAPPDFMSGVALSKLDPQGNYITHIAVNGQSHAIPMAVAIDNNGDVLVSGVSHGDLDGIASQGEGDIFLLRFRF